MLLHKPVSQEGGNSQQLCGNQDRDIKLNSWPALVKWKQLSESPITFTVPVLRFPVREFGLGWDCCYSDFQGAFQEGRDVGVFREIAGHLEDPLCGGRTSLSLQSHRPDAQDSVFIVFSARASSDGQPYWSLCSKHSARVHSCQLYYEVTFLHIRTESDQKCSFSCVLDPLRAPVNFPHF